jgi:serine/threonine protein kinase
MPEYVAPEMFIKKTIGPEVDWYCLGVLIYEMLSGKLPINYEKEPLEVPIFFTKDMESLITGLL